MSLLSIGYALLSLRRHGRFSSSAWRVKIHSYARTPAPLKIPTTPAPTTHRPASRCG